MNAPLSLSKARKAREKMKKRQQADENAVKYGKTKAERVLEATQNDKARRALDGHEFEQE